jgi:hypothetical protein
MCITVRVDFAGVTSLVRAMGLDAFYYDRILDFFHSSGINIQFLKILWTKIVIKSGLAYKAGDRVIVVGDGIKIPKEGRKMPGVKSLHQESESNTKAEYIMGHSFQAIAILTSAMGYFFATPLAAEIHEGIVESNRDCRTLLGKMATLVQSLSLTVPMYFLGDAYYAKQTLILPLLKAGTHIITRVAKSAVAYYPPAKSPKRKRGRPKLYGRKIKLIDIFKDTKLFIEATGSIYGDENVKLRYRSIDLFWRPVGILVRFVFVIHPNRGNAIFLSTDFIDPIEIIKIYSLRYKIEVSFKQALHTIGAFTYHFWMREMTRIKRCSGNQYLHKKSEEYREQVKRKINAYHVYTQTALIVQGILQLISMTIHQEVWINFGSWIRTIRPNILPSEAIVMKALRHTVSDFLASKQIDLSIGKFIIEKIDFTRAEGLRLFG